MRLVDEDARAKDDLVVLLAFSGGGTRAAALAYGVLETLRDTPVVVNGKGRQLLDEVDLISSVSGGSVTAAYYGLYGSRIFTDFDDHFLKRDFESSVVSSLLNPLKWFDSEGRTENLVRQFNEELFDGATFSDMLHLDGPLILINTSDLAEGVRLSFTQEYFDLLCTDLSSFPIARAVAASAAVPLVLNPVVVKNHGGCIESTPKWITAAEHQFAGDPERELIIDGLKTYLNKDERLFVHMVDGGITDNLGLRAIGEIVDLAGGPTAFQKKMKSRPPRQVAVIVVDASTDVAHVMDASNEEPNLGETIDAMTDAQLHRYSAATLKSFRSGLTRWAAELSTSGPSVEPYFIWLSFDNIANQTEKRYVNSIPTSFHLSPAQVDHLTVMGRQLLKKNPEFQRLLRDIEY